MTLDELQERVWQQLPSITRTLAGRAIAGRIVRRAVRGWPVPVLEQCDEGETQVVGTHYARSLERSVRGEMQMGIILTLVLSALVSEIVKALVRWWLENHANRNAMRLLIREIRNHD